MIIHNAIFTSNEGFEGGAIYNNGCMIIIESSYIGNIARNFGGAIFNTTIGNIIFTPHAQYNIPFDNNFAYTRGGAIYMQSKKTEIELKRVGKGRDYPEFIVKE